MIASLSLNFRLPLPEDFSGTSELIESVFLIPSGVTSNIHESMIVIGNPIISRMMMKVTVQSGSPSLGSIISAASMIIKAVAAYIVITLMTFLRFNSFQNWDSFLGEVAIYRIIF